MLKQYFLVFALIIFCAAQTFAALRFSPSESDLTDIVQWRVNFSDSAHFSNPKYDDRHWDTASIVGLWKLDEQGADGIRWYRARIFVSEYIPSTENLAIFVPMVISAYEVFWNGVKIGESGRVADNIYDEIIGRSAGIFTIPHDYSQIGEHILALRISNFSTISGFVSESPQIGFMSNIFTSSLQTLSVSFLIVGILLITALFNFVFIAKSLNIKAHICFAVLSLCCTGYILIPVFSSVFPFNLSHYYSLVLWGDIFWFGILSLLPIYLYLVFEDEYWKIKSIVIFSVCVVLVVFPRLAFYDIVPISTIWVWDFANQIFAIISVIVSIVIAFRAAIQRKKGAKMLLVGLVVFAIGVFFSFAFRQISTWATSFAVLSVFMTVVMGRFFWAEMREKSALEVRSARLELELLKGHISPHFLLNSLNSIIAWIEEDPKNATKLVSELSKELRLLMAFAERKTVSLSEEILLCRAHIQVMNLRKEKEISLKVHGNIDNITVPPLILHTALENGITHGFVKKDKGIFNLSVENTPKKIRIILKNDGDNKVSQNKTDLSGTGNKYIVKRLNELYENDFSFNSTPSPDGWQVVFEIPNDEKKPLS
ncbi:MAG: histidine kinase [Chitinivibrionia bacterium]|nr:histidine kinase [Chitinivibrionia bacterium]